MLFDTFSVCHLLLEESISNNIIKTFTCGYPGNIPNIASRVNKSFEKCIQIFSGINNGLDNYNRRRITLAKRKPLITD